MILSELVVYWGRPIPLEVSWSYIKKDRENRVEPFGLKLEVVSLANIATNKLYRLY